MNQQESDLQVRKQTQLNYCINVSIEFLTQELTVTVDVINITTLEQQTAIQVHYLADDDQIVDTLL